MTYGIEFKIKNNFANKIHFFLSFIYYLHNSLGRFFIIFILLINKTQIMEIGGDRFGKDSDSFEEI